MKTLKPVLLITLLCLLAHFSFAQKMYNVHQDNVKPSKLMQYEETAKAFLEACKKHKPKANWIVANTNDFKYLYISPLENYAELDEKPFADMAKSMGDSFGELFQKFDECYESHGNYTIILDEELSYMPDGMSQTQEGQNHRKWFFMYYEPHNAKKVREGMKAVKELFERKNSPEHYRVYQSGFGNIENYYVVTISSKDEIDAAQRGKANQEILGSQEERWEAFSKVMNNIYKMEEVNGQMRPDLAYSSE